MEDKSWYPKCPKCNEPMSFEGDEDTGHQWWRCHNPECSNLELYEQDQIERDNSGNLHVKGGLELTLGDVESSKDV